MNNTSATATPASTSNTTNAPYDSWYHDFSTALSPSDQLVNYQVSGDGTRLVTIKLTNTSCPFVSTMDAYTSQQEGGSASWSAAEPIAGRSS